MNQKSKEVLPKVKRKLKNFLTDESGKIAKKDALWIAIWSGLFFAGMETAWAGATHSASVNHTNAQCGHVNQAHGSGYARNGHLSGSIPGTASVTINGHYSALPSTWHQSGYIQWGHSSQAAINDPKHCNTSTHSSHTNY